RNKNKVNEILVNPYFSDFVVPLISVLLTMGIKIVSRKDNYMTPQREDFAVGFDLLVTSLILITVFASRAAYIVSKNDGSNIAELKNKLDLLPWIIVSFVFGLWSLSTIVRIKGWDLTSSSNPVLHKFWGVGLPTLIGIVALLLTVKYFK
ncbi:hypothetical protein, partial [Flavobacterium sp. AJR]|uniref:hypothetical protein n=1 Tax=Flavobacterium sp. AJR TaxID=1979369 RepID=UPI000B755AA0